MEHAPTILQQLKSYPTYQFHAEITSDQMNEREVFLRLILETYQWLRDRLKGSGRIPRELDTPQPDAYSEFSEAQLRSFTLDMGWKAEVTYAAERGLWAFSLREADMGANRGTPEERPPVQGRLFETDISFVRCGGCVECGVRTVCTEPQDCDAKCEVFRPAVVRSILVNPQFRVSHGGMLLDAKPFMIASKSDAERFADVFQDQVFDYPLILIADAGYEEPAAEPAAPLPKPGGLSLQFGMMQTDLRAPQLSGSDAPKPFLAGKTPHVQKKEKPAALPRQNAGKPKQRRAEFPAERLAEHLKGYGIVCCAQEKMLPILDNKLHLDLHCGDILVCVRGKIHERLRYGVYSRDMEGSYQRLKSEMQSFPRRRAYSFGNVIFQADAHLIALQERRESAQTLEESCTLYQQEIAELKARLAELQQQDADLRERNDLLRARTKQLKDAEEEIAALKLGMQTMQAEYDERQAAYEASAALIGFYRKKTEIAAGFPLDKDAVCDWAEALFSGTLIITQRARAELRKYRGSLDVALLCDGLLYLDAYARRRSGAITEEELALYTDQRNWEVSFSGKEAVRLYEDAYTVLHDGRKYQLDMHIKYGTRAGSLIRIYFTRDAESGKVIVGSMPEHLPTAARST